MKSAGRLFKYDHSNMTEKKDNAIVAYFKSALEEYGKITWPTKEQAAMLTAISVVVSGAVAALIGLVDLGFAEAYQFILDLV